MTIIRQPRPTANYTIVDNLTIRDTRLSWAARGILIYLLSMPDNWRTSADRLATCGPNGRTYIQSALTELEAVGYVRRKKTQDERGRWSTELHVYDRPKKTRVENLVEKRRKSETPTTENPTSVNPSSKEQLSNNDLSKDLEKILGTRDKVCGECQGSGRIPQGFAGFPSFCPECQGDGLSRP